MNDTQYMGDNQIGLPGSMVSILVVMVVGLILWVVPCWKIFRKAGFSGWWSLALLIPGINVFMMYYLAFADWPSLRGRNLAIDPPPAHSHRAVPPHA